MDIDSAIKILKKHAKVKIANIYDNNDEVSEAILIVDECFEYPECSYMTVGFWLKRILDTTHFKSLTKWPNF